MAYNPTTKTITIIDTSQKIINPVMDVIQDSTRVVGSLPNSLFIKIDFRCINEGIAFNIRDKITTFGFLNNQFIETGSSLETINTSLKSYGKQALFLKSALFLPKNIIPNNPDDTTFIFFKAVYCNREINGMDQPPLRALYYLKLERYPKDVDELKIYELEDQIIYLKVKKTLIEKKIW